MPQEINQHQIDACLLVRAILLDEEVTFIYTDTDEVVSVRYAKPYAIERCIDGTTIVRAHDTQRNATRKFRYSGILTGSVHQVEVVE